MASNKQERPPEYPMDNELTKNNSIYFVIAVEPRELSVIKLSRHLQGQT